MIGSYSIHVSGREKHEEAIFFAAWVGFCSISVLKARLSPRKRLSQDSYLSNLITQLGEFSFTPTLYLQLKSERLPTVPMWGTRGFMWNMNPKKKPQVMRPVAFKCKWPFQLITVTLMDAFVIEHVLWKCVLRLIVLPGSLEKTVSLQVRYRPDNWDLALGGSESILGWIKVKCLLFYLRAT